MPTMDGCRDFIGYGRTPPDPRWPDKAGIAVNIVVNYEEGSEPSFPDGDEVSETGLTEGGGGGFEGRDLAAESMFEYGSRVGFWRVARLLSERGTAATIFGCAVALERHPEVAAAIRQLGYDICCHGYRWSVISHSLWSASVRGSPPRSRVSSEPVASVRAVGIVAMVPV
jgi:allantoinase